MELLPAALLPAAARLPAATLIRLRKARRRPAGIQQPGSLIEPLNVKVNGTCGCRKTGQDIDPSTALTLIDDTTTTKPITSNSYLLKWAHLP